MLIVTELKIVNNNINRNNTHTHGTLKNSALDHGSIFQKYREKRKMRIKNMNYIYIYIYMDYMHWHGLWTWVWAWTTDMDYKHGLLTNYYGLRNMDMDYRHGHGQNRWTMDLDYWPKSRAMNWHRPREPKTRTRTKENPRWEESRAGQTRRHRWSTWKRREEGKTRIQNKTGNSRDDTRRMSSGGLVRRLSSDPSRNHTWTLIVAPVTADCFWSWEDGTPWRVVSQGRGAETKCIPIGRSLLDSARD